MPEASPAVRVLRLAACALAGILLAGCTSQGPVAPLANTLSITIERGEGVPPGRLVMKPIPGGLLGKARDIELHRSPAGDVLQVAVGNLNRELSGNVALARSDDFNPGELANPRLMKIVRVATFFRSTVRTTSCNNFSTRLKAEWPSRAMLVYVDRAGTLRGTRYSAPWVMEYDLAFPSPGLYAIGMRTRGQHVMQRVIPIDQPLVAEIRRAPCAGGTLAAR